MSRALARHFAVTASALAVAAVVLVGAALTRLAAGNDGASDQATTDVASVGGQQPQSPAAAFLAGSSIELFSGTADAPDTKWTVDTNAAAPWTVRECASGVTADVTRRDFISGTETGPEYVRSAQVGLYGDAAAASAAAGALRSSIERCAATAGSITVPAEVPIGDHTDVRFVESAASAGLSATVSTYAIAVVGRAVVLTADTSALIDDTPAPVDAASPTAAELRHLLAELCRLALVPCSD